MTTTYELWQHKVSGEVYAVAHDCKTISAAAGPLHSSEWDAALTGDFDDDPEVREDLTNDSSSYKLVLIPE